MRLTNLTRATEIGANSYCVTLDDARFVLDCGLHPRGAGRDAMPRLDLIKNESIDGIFLSHCHLDHLGSLPVLMRAHAEAEVYMTSASAELADLMLHNSCNVMMKERDERGIADYPLFTHKQVDQLKEFWRTIRYRRPFCPTTREAETEITAEFYDAGHVLGSAGIRLSSPRETLFYTGDVNFTAQTLMPAADFPEEPADVLMIETTRGLHESPEPYSRQREVERLAASIARILAAGGSVLLPCFALGKQQEVLAILWQMMQNHTIPHSTVFIGGMGKQVTRLYDRLAMDTPRQWPRLNLMEALDLNVLEMSDSKAMKLGGGRIFAVSAGMMTEPTHSFVLARRFLDSPHAGIFFVGYVDPESPAGLLKAAAAAGTEVALSPGLRPQRIRCEVDSFDFTAHAQREDLLNYVLRVKPRMTVLVHGDEGALHWFAGKLDEHRLRWLIPESGKEYEL
ncbi:MAG: MBL fold metallo-hydrolase [Verrucomicrobiae bacterium]|nr:MBL fold metallo-hydrolase [Verrucomicrobiae bacterium]